MNNAVDHRQQFNILDIGVMIRDDLPVGISWVRVMPFRVRLGNILKMKTDWQAKCGTREMQQITRQRLKRKTVMRRIINVFDAMLSSDLSNCCRFRPKALTTTTVSAVPPLS